MALKGTAAEKYERDRQVVEDRLVKQKTWKEIAATHNISDRMGRYIVRQHITTGGELSAEKYNNPTKIIDDLLAGYETDVWELTEAAELATEANNVAALVGAVKGRMDARARIVELLQATNRLPKNLGHLSVIYDVRFLVEQVVEVLKVHDVPIEAKRDLMARLGPALEGSAMDRTVDAA